MIYFMKMEKGLFTQFGMHIFPLIFGGRVAFDV